MLRFVIDSPPLTEDTAILRDWAFTQFQRIQYVLETVHDHDTENAAPSKPRQGWVRYADGTNWNPGSSEGLYVYDGTSWNKL
jgi:hypothetical protein